MFLHCYVCPFGYRFMCATKLGKEVWKDFYLLSQMTAWIEVLRVRLLLYNRATHAVRAADRGADLFSFT